MRFSVYLSIFALVSACGGGGAQTTEQHVLEDGTVVEGSKASTSKDGGPRQIAIPGGAATPISYMSFGQGKLHLGTTDGWVGSAQILNRTSNATRISNTGVQVVAVSSGGELALLNSRPPQVVNQDGALILNLNMVPVMESGIFAADSFSLFVSEATGRVRVWGQAHSFEVPKGDEKLENYLNKQASDFSVTFAPLAGPIHLMPGGTMIFADQDGVISMWNPAKPSQSKRIMKVEGRVKSLSSSGNEVVATSDRGQLKAGKLDPPSFFGWAREAKGDYAAMSDLLRGKFVESSEGVIRLRVAETGDVEWEVPAPGKPCGVAISEDGNFAAVCRDNKMLILSTRDGSWDSTIWMMQGLHWQDSSGQAIAK